MSYIDSENCFEHLMTIGMGLDRAPFEFQKWVFFGTPYWDIVMGEFMGLIYHSLIISGEGLI